MPRLAERKQTATQANNIQSPIRTLSWRRNLRRMAVCGKHPKQSGHFKTTMENTATCDVHFAYPHPIHKSKTLKCVFKNLLENFSAWWGASTMCKYSTVKILRSNFGDNLMLNNFSNFKSSWTAIRLRQYILMQSRKKIRKEKQYNYKCTRSTNTNNAIHQPKKSHAFTPHCAGDLPARRVPPLPAETTWQRASNQHFMRLYKCKGNIS